MPRGSIRSHSLRLALSGALAAAAVTALASPAGAAVCNFDAATRQATAFISDAEPELRFVADGANLKANGSVCGALTAIDSVVADLGSRSSGTVVLDLGGGALAPGFTNEANGSSEIEFTVINQSTLGSIRVAGTSGNDTITVGQGSGGQINLNPTTDGTTPDVDVSFAFLPFRLQVDGKGGDDNLAASGVLDATSPYLGNTTLVGGAGSNELDGGSGNDELHVLTEVSSTGSDTVTGGDGFDQVIIDTESTSITSTYSLDGIANDGVGCPGTGCEGDDVGSSIEGIRGSGGAETLIGSTAGDVLSGGGGADLVKGLVGPDTLYCAGGKTLGGSGDDALLASLGCSSVSGGTGHDEVSFGDASEGVTVTLDDLKNDGVPGIPVNVRTDIEDIAGSFYGDSLTGDDGRNVLLGGNGRDELFGGGGNDRLEGLKGNDTLSGGLGDDKLLGGAGDDAMDGGDGTDVCTQGPGSGTPFNCE